MRKRRVPNKWNRCQLSSRKPHFYQFSFLLIIIINNTITTTFSAPKLHSETSARCVYLCVHLLVTKPITLLVIDCSSCILERYYFIIIIVIYNLFIYFYDLSILKCLHYCVKEYVHIHKYLEELTAILSWSWDSYVL